ncbi:MAG TPA: hypothetical protein VKU41_12380 [Polyangiaceae bacterium]|nr:hypothetical protein [Polyangiaceae bacterium]
MMRHALGGAFAAGLLLASGTAFSSDQIVAEVHVLNFNVITQELRGQPVEGPPLLFVHTPNTAHGLSIVDTTQHPPDPCFAIAANWNATVFLVSIDHIPRTLTFEFLLGLMAPFQCPAQVTASTAAQADGAFPILSIAPVISVIE